MCTWNHVTGVIAVTPSHYLQILISRALSRIGAFSEVYKFSPPSTLQLAHFNTREIFRYPPVSLYFNQAPQNILECHSGSLTRKDCCFSCNSENLYLLCAPNLPLCWKSTDLDFFFYRNLVDFNEARLHEETYKLHTHAWIFSRLSIASVDDKQHLSDSVKCSRLIFIVRKITKQFGFRILPVLPGTDYGVHEVEVTVCGVQQFLFL